jgi:hypothetical protein
MTNKGAVSLSPSVAQAIAGAESSAELKRQLDERATVAAAEAAKPLPLGLHFDLPEERHHADHGLGSTNIRMLAKSPADYWHESWMNPSRPEDRDTEARLIGRAMHKLVFEGNIFGRMYARGPDQRGMTTAEKTKSTKDANEAARIQGKVSIKADAYDRIVMAAEMIKRNPHLATAFENGRAEVTFIYEVDGIRRKVRYDYIKAVQRSSGIVAGVGDLKSVQNELEKPIEQACYDAVANWRYDVQAQWYLDAMPYVAAAIREGRVYGFDGDMAFLDRLQRHTVAAFQFVFFQKTRAPITFSMSLSPGSQYLEAGQHTIQRALDNFRVYRDRYGTDMWIEIHPVCEAEIERMPSWWAR